MCYELMPKRHNFNSVFPREAVRLENGETFGPHLLTKGESTMEQESRKKIIGKVVAKAWTDEGYKQRLLSDPATVLKEEGIAVPEGVQIKVVENSDKVFHFVLPPQPASDELSDEQLNFGGAACCSGSIW